MFRVCPYIIYLLFISFYYNYTITIHYVRFNYAILPCLLYIKYCAFIYIYILYDLSL